jgi:peptide/nickel transport system substrate-binding protein
VCELVKGYWEAVGIRTNVKDVANNYGPLGNANKLDFQIWHLGNSEEIGIFMNSFGFDPYAMPYQLWRVTDGKQGEEPPAVIKQYYSLAAEFATQPYGSEGYKRLGKELVAHHVRNLLHIGLVGMTPKAAIVKKNLASVPDKDTWGYVYRFWTVFYPDQWYWRK